MTYYQEETMARLEQIAALVLAAGLAIPSYWLFWTMAGGGGYDRRNPQKIPLVKEQTLEKLPKTAPTNPREL